LEYNFQPLCTALFYLAISVGLSYKIEFDPFLFNLPRSDTCDGNSSACPVAGGVELTTTSPKPESGSNKSEPVSALGFLKRMIFW
jgi:hypothetical protein